MKNNETIQTNWYVITGGPSTGKTTMINMLAERGYKTTIEHARHYIDTMRVDGQTVEELRSNKREFQHGVLKMQIEQEASLNPNDVVFLDRAIPDGLAYYQFLGLEVDKILKEAMRKVNYKMIFILDKLPLVNDYARLESKNDQNQIHNLITEVYESLPFPVIHVPVLPPSERTNFILNSIKNN
ncbi:AAA family ATPase [Bizionia arctica]|uniref:ATPase n=1 Tax=Bizionia arctica TaxID=1495645 RepID=A0A917LMA7_9FLAO|nr:ATP-binding protein [Bizionia arctica]GGG43769.1 ATPase [Bizionia arctica]